MDEYSEADVRLVVDVLPVDLDDGTTVVGWRSQVEGEHATPLWDSPEVLARAILAALAGAGRLLPADARREQDAKDAVLADFHQSHPRIPGLDKGDCHCNLLVEVAFTALRRVGSWVSVEPEQGRAEAGAYDQASPVTTTRPGPAEEAYGETTLIPSVPVVNEPPTEHFLDEHDRAAIGLYADEPDVEIAMQMLPAGAEAFGVEPDHVRAAEETVEWGWDRGLFAQTEPLTFEQVRERADWGYSGWPVCRCQGGEWVEVPEKPVGVLIAAGLVVLAGCWTTYGGHR